jgi:hypothetical protein
MDQKLSVSLRAFYVAGTGQVANVTELKRLLKRDGCDTTQIQGHALHRQLRFINAVRAAEIVGKRWRGSQTKRPPRAQRWRPQCAVSSWQAQIKYFANTLPKPCISPNHSTLCHRPRLTMDARESCQRSAVAYHFCRIFDDALRVPRNALALFVVIVVVVTVSLVGVDLQFSERRHDRHVQPVLLVDDSLL